jgi:hypothetical protein
MYFKPKNKPFKKKRLQNLFTKNKNGITITLVKAIKAILLNFKNRPRNQIYDFRADFVQAPFKYFW